MMDILHKILWNFSPMSFVSLIKNTSIGMLTIGLLIKIYGNQYKYRVLDVMCEFLGYSLSTKEQVFIVFMSIMSLFLMFCNYFAFKVAKRFLIENLYVLLTNYLLVKTLRFSFEKIGDIFLSGIIILFIATISEKVREVKLILFTAFCIMNIFIFTILMIPHLEIVLLTLKHNYGL